MQIWKKWTAAVTAGLILTGGMTVIQTTLPVYAEELTYANLTYTFLENGTISIQDCDESAVRAEIPAEINGTAVTAIGNWAFSGCTALTELEIPSSVTSIGSSAFTKTPWLAAKQAEDPLVIVNGILIDGTTYTGDLIIPDSVTCIGYSAFLECAGLTSVTIPDSVTSIQTWAFECCPDLTNVIISKGITEIGANVFRDCPMLTSITIPTSVKSIRYNAFAECTTLSDIYYSGTEEERNAIAFIGSTETTEQDKYPLKNATVHFQTTTTETTVQTTTTSITETAAKTDTLLCGDVTLDAKIDLSDVVLLNKIVSGSVIPNQEARDNADCNGDGGISADDSMKLLQFLVHLIQALPDTE